MDMLSLPQKAEATLLEDAAQRDRTTARRAYLLRLLWRERYLTRDQLVARVEGKLGRDCFGGSAWEDTFYRDMRVVKSALKSAGYRLAYARSLERPGYYLEGRPAIGPNLVQTLDGSVAGVDPAQIAIFRRLTPAQRFRLGRSITDAALAAVAYRLRRRNPEISQSEAYRLALSQTAAA